MSHPRTWATLGLIAGLGLAACSVENPAVPVPDVGAPDADSPVTSPPTLLGARAVDASIGAVFALGGDTCTEAIPLTADVTIGGSLRATGGLPSTACRPSAAPQRFYSFLLPPGQRATVTLEPITDVRVVLRVLDRCDATTCIVDTESMAPGAAASVVIDSPGDEPLTKIVTASGVDPVEGAFRLTVHLAPIAADPVRIAEFALGGEHTCARMTDRTVRCWGSNDYGQLGDGTLASRATPQPVPGLNNVVQLSASGTRTCALVADGTLWCWGQNDRGLLGVDAGSEVCSVIGTPTACRIRPTQIPSLAGVTRIDVGPRAMCAVIDDGTARCWGLNFTGQLGDGTLTDRLVPGVVPGLTGVADIAVSDFHVCARMTDGTLQCWGFNDLGQLGTAPSAENCPAGGNPMAPRTAPCRRSPAPVVGVTGVAGVAISRLHTCVHSIDGHVVCWGGNPRNVVLGFDSGSEMCAERGAFVMPCTRVPREVPGLANVIDAAASDATTCVVRSDRAVLCWGFNVFGQIGDATATERATPTLVVGLPPSVDVEIQSRHACAAALDGTARCWGRNDAGQLGFESTQLCSRSPCRLAPTPVPGLTGVVEVSLGRASCARMSDGTVQCWGDNNGGMLGRGVSSGVEVTSAPVTGLVGVAQIAVGSEHVCARMNDGTVQCWGTNTYGRLGYETPHTPEETGASFSPRPVPGLVGVAQIALGVYHSCARMNDGTVQCWGNNGNGQLGDGTTIDRTAPSPVAGLTGVVDLVSAWFHNCARLADHTVRCWGLNAGGQLGNGTQTDALMPVTVVRSGTPLAVSQIATGGFHSCARAMDNTVLCWGRNWNGALGAGPLPIFDQLEPLAVHGLTNVVDLASEYLTTCALRGDGTVWCWGSNHRGQLGDGNTIDRDTPTQVPSLTGVAQVATSSDTACARMVDGTVQCWGDHYQGRLGDDPARWCFGVACQRVPFELRF